MIQDLINLAPRKPDWDLKRDVAKKLEKLERRTQRAIAELISKDQCHLITITHLNGMNTAVKSKFSDIKICDIFLFSAQNIDNGYSLKPPHSEKALKSTHNLGFEKS